MKIKTLMILSVVFFLLGTAGGGAYAYISGGNVLEPVVSMLPTPKSEEEKLIDEFIEQQEQKHAQEGEQPQEDSQDDAQTSQPSAQDPSNDEPKANPPAQSTGQSTDKAAVDKVNSEVRMGQPTVVDGKTLRVRTEPHTDAEVLIGLPNSEKVQIIAEKNGWYQIITDNGTKGWVSAEFMKEL